MVVQGHIGLNEVAIGISVPLYWGRLMARIIGEKAAEHLCKFAVLLPPREALKVAFP
jgi:3,2-trans-enoyl-CoA isomerase